MVCFGIFWPSRVGDGAGSEEEVGEAGGLGHVAGGYVAEVEEYLLIAGLGHGLELGFDLLDVIVIEDAGLEIEDAGVLVHRLGDRGQGDDRARHGDLFGGGAAGADDRDGELRAGGTFEEHLDHGEGDVAGVLGADGFEDVAVGEVRLIGGTSGDDGDDSGVAVAFGDVDADLGLAGVASLVDLVGPRL